MNPRVIKPLVIKFVSKTYQSSRLAALTGLALSATALSVESSHTAPVDSHLFSQFFISTALAETRETLSVGTIQGTVIYPSDILPAQRVCAVNTQTRGAYCTETGEEQSQFSLPVRPGTYHVYAIACRDYLGQPGTNCQNRNYDDQIRAYYDEFVTCGLYANCGSKLPISVTVRAGETVTGVSPHDWYP